MRDKPRAAMRAAEPVYLATNLRRMAQESAKRDIREAEKEAKLYATAWETWAREKKLA